MIRFSAGLVIVAIGALIAGAATSKLLLVYVAIAISVAALLALAIGVALKREEVFADSRQPATAGAGPGDGQPVSVDAGQLQPAGRPGQDSPRPADLSRPAGQPRPWLAEPGAPWDTAPAGRDSRDPWAPRDRDPRVAGDRDRPGSEQFGAETRQDTPPWRDRPAPTFTPAADAAKTTPAGSAGPGSAGPGAGSAGGAGVAARSSWFDRRAGEAAAATAAAAAAAAANNVKQAGTAEGPATESAKPASSSSGETAASGSTSPSGPDADDDWPTRYSWLDDESDETPSDDAPSSEAPSSEAPPVEVPPVGAPSDETRAATKDERAEPPTIAAALPRTTDTAQADDAASSEPPTVVSSAIQLVTVVPGVPRYHEANCILIRFMSDDDVQKLTIPEAKEAGCTPCAACQPEE